MSTRNAFKLFKKASQLEMTNENLVNAKKNPFNFDEWLSEISEFKKNIINEYTNKFKVMEKSQVNTLKAKRMN